MVMKTSSTRMSRRRFIGSAAVTFATIQFIPSGVLGLRGAPSANERLNIACIGVGGRGYDNLQSIKGQSIVALCDVDEKRASGAFGQYPKARRFQDYRKMLDEMDKEIDAVVVSTPDHTHAVAACRAIKMGKHVYCEKPLAHSIHEVRALMTAAREHKVATQLGNQGHSFDSIRTFCEYIWDGAIGNVREVHAFCNSVYSGMNRLEMLKERPPVPEGLDWNLWLGPVAERPYHPLYVPGKWRSWSAFGTGVPGDWSCHVLDPVFWALHLEHPSAIQAETGAYDPKVHGETFPQGTIITYDFPAKGDRPAVKIKWFDGNQLPPRPEELESNRQLPGIGAIVIGDKGKILYGSHGAGGAQIIPAAKMKEYPQPAQKLPRSPGHHEEWIAACKGGAPAGSNFEYGGPMVETALLGLMAIRFKGQKLEWDTKKLQFTNCPEANQLLTPTFRKGWNL